MYVSKGASRVRIPLSPPCEIIEYSKLGHGKLVCCRICQVRKEAAGVICRCIMPLLFYKGVILRVLAILAHPRKESLSGHFFYKTVEHLKSKNIDVDVLDLYDRKDEIPFYIQAGAPGWDEQGWAKYPFYTETKERFMSADRIFIVYPLYWYAVPGILKCWIDLITNYAWKYDKGPYGIPLHKIKKALVVNSASMSNWF